jgi:hypothetical protein
MSKSTAKSSKPAIRPFVPEPPKPRQRPHKKNVWVRLLEVHSGQKIDANKIRDYVGSPIIIETIEDDYRGSANGTAINCTGARAIQRLIPDWQLVAFGNSVGYALAQDGSCTRFMHDNIINITQDNGELPVGKRTTLTAPAPTMRLAGTSFKSRAANPGEGNRTVKTGKSHSQVTGLGIIGDADCTVTEGIGLKKASPATSTTTSPGVSKNTHDKGKAGHSSTASDGAVVAAPKRKPGRYIPFSSKMRMKSALEELELVKAAKGARQ